jgi:hypothetical protein
MSDKALPFSLPATAVLLAFALLGVLTSLVLLARRKLTMSYTIVWISAFLGAGVLISVPYLLSSVARMLSSDAPDGALRLLAFLTVVGFLVFFSVKVSELTHRLEDLIQRMALVDYSLREQINKQPSAPPVAKADEPESEDAKDGA